MAVFVRSLTRLGTDRRNDRNDKNDKPQAGPKITNTKIIN